jgi:hypothetical protein
MTHGYAHTNGGRRHYVEQGSGPLVVLLNVQQSVVILSSDYRKRPRSYCGGHVMRAPRV